MSGGYTTASDIRLAAADAYRALTAPRSLCIRQSQGAAGFAHSERHLQCVWFDPFLRPTALKTRDGDTVTVVSPGRWNLEAGPDFLDATLQLGPDARHLRGDVEVHIHPSDWDRHGHAGDPRYRSVIAHVTFASSPRSPDDLPPGAVEIAMRDALAAIPSFDMDAVYVTAYPYAAVPAEPCPCAGVLRDWTPAQRGGMLEAAGVFRIEQKASALAIPLRRLGSDETAYRETMAALGYKHNAAAFRALAGRVPADALRACSPLGAYALLLGVGGLLPEAPSPRWSAGARDFIRTVWDAWWPQQARWASAAMPRSAWTLASLRPHNHPARRLAAAATLLAGQPPLAARLAATLARVGFGGLAALFEPGPPLAYWSHHLGLGTGRGETATALVGSARLASWYTSVVLPLLAAGGDDITPLLATIPPEQTNSVMRQCAHRLFGRDHNPALYARSGLRQQGLMQIFRDFCLSERTGCASCAFPAALAPGSALV